MVTDAAALTCCQSVYVQTHEPLVDIKPCTEDRTEFVLWLHARAARLSFKTHPEISLFYYSTYLLGHDMCIHPSDDTIASLLFGPVWLTLTLYG